MLPETPWWEQFPPLSEDTELFIELERGRIHSEIKGQPSAPENQPLLERIRSDPENGFDHGVFAQFIILGLDRHILAMSEKQLQKWRGNYDEAYGSLCRTYEHLLTEGKASSDWVDTIPDHDINMLPEPVIVTMLVGGVIDRRRTGGVAAVLHQLSRFRPPQPKKR